MPTYIFKDKKGVELGRADAATVFAASEGLGIKEYSQVEEIKETGVNDLIDHTETTVLANANNAKKPRKPRTPKAKSPDKPKRNRGQYFICTGVLIAADRQKAAEWLNEHMDSEARIIQGRELKFERKIHFTLKPIK